MQPPIVKPAYKHIFSSAMRIQVMKLESLEQKYLHSLRSFDIITVLRMEHALHCQVFVSAVYVSLLLH